MPISINTNLEAINARRYMTASAEKLSNAQAQLSSGLRSPDPSDNPSASAVGSVLDANISVLRQVSQNTSQAISLVQLATGVLSSTTEILNKMSTLASQADSDTIDDSKRGMLDQEFQLLLAQIDSNAQTKWGNVTLFNGGIGTATSVATNATVLVGGTDVFPAGVADSFATTVKSSGLVCGAASNAEVIKNGDVYNISVTVGKQIFSATTKPLVGSNIVLVSQADTNNSITITYAAAVTAITEAPDPTAAFENKLQELFGISTAAPVSFQPISTTVSGITVTPGSSAVSGAYSVSYDNVTATFRLSNEHSVYTAQAHDSSGNNLTTSAAIAAATSAIVTFDDGTKVTLNEAACDLCTADIAQQIFWFNASDSGTSMSFQTGIMESDCVSVVFNGSSGENLGLSGISIAKLDDAGNAVTALSSAIDLVNQQVANLGGKKSRLEYIAKNLPIFIQNTEAAKSTFTDADISESLMASQQQQSLFDISSSMLQKSMQRQSQISRLVQSVLNM